MHISTFKRHSSFFSKSRLFIIMDYELYPSLEKGNTDVREMWFIISEYFLFPFFFCETEKCFLCQKWGLTPSQLWINFHRKPQPAPITSDIHLPPLCLLTAPQGFRDSSCPVHHLKGQLWDCNLSDRAHPAMLPSDTSLEDSRDQQTPRNSPLLTLHDWCSVEKPLLHHREEA